MNGGGKSDRSIVPEMLSNKDCGIPQTAEKAEERDLTKENPLQQNKFRTQCRERGTIWTTLNGHEAGNHGHSQGNKPTSTPQTCKVRCNGYGRLLK